MAREPTAFAQLKVRLRELLRLRLERAASVRGHSLNAEIVRRLEQSFEHDDFLAMVRFFEEFAVGKDLDPGQREALDELRRSHPAAWEVAYARNIGRVIQKDQ